MRFDETLCRRLIEAIPNFRWCMNSVCSAGQIIPNIVCMVLCSLRILIFCSNYTFLLLLRHMRLRILSHMWFSCTFKYHLCCRQDETHQTRAHWWGGGIDQMAQCECKSLLFLWTLLWEDLRMWSYCVRQKDWWMWCRVVLELWCHIWDD
jgi:hypothetical protein